MRSALSSATLASTFAVLGLFACKQEEPQVQPSDYPVAMAEGYCTAVFGCQCDSYPYTNITECYSELVAAYDAVNDEAYLAGLAYDGTCPAKELETIESLACKGYVPPVPDGLCVQPCMVWHGNLAAGYPCAIFASSAELGLAFSNCAQGLVCNQGVCANPCQGNVLPSIGQPCPDLVCAAGAYCDETTMTCVAEPALPGPGQACDNGVCDPRSAVCVQAANTCAALPQAGQACVEFSCALDSYCGPDEICLPKQPLACGLLGGGIPGDGDGDTTDPTTTDPTTTDPTTGDGDGDGDTTAPGECTPTALPSTDPSGYAGNTSAEPSSYEGTCGGAGSPEAVLSYVAPAAGIYFFSLEGSDFDTLLYLRDGSCDGAELACNDDTFDLASAVEVSLAAGQEVTIFVDALDGGGNYVLSIQTI